jgi:DNA-binding HxlR family transcriptional regulator
MSGYAQFCPIALACEVVAERWTPLVLRELILTGSRRFEDIKRGVPSMSRSMLAKRLDQLESAGVIERRMVGGGSKHPQYEVTSAGHELYPVLEQLGIWGHRWVRHDLRDDQLDASYLMWNISRRIDHERVPVPRVVVLFEFEGTPAAKRRFWLIIDRPNCDVCLTNPNFPVDLTVRAPIRTISRPSSGLPSPSRRAAPHDGRARPRGRTRRVRSARSASAPHHAAPRAPT